MKVNGNGQIHFSEPRLINKALIKVGFNEDDTCKTFLVHNKFVDSVNDLLTLLLDEDRFVHFLYNTSY